MNNKLTTLIFLIFTLSASAQTLSPNTKYPYRELSVEPALGTSLSSAMGKPDIQLSALIQYSYNKRFSILAHTSLLNGFNTAYVPDVKQNYTLSASQKFGIGTSLYTNRTSSGFFLIGGFKYQAYSGTLENNQLPEKVTTETSSLTPDYGLMYNLKSGRKKYYFSGRMYIPLTDGSYGAIENASLEFGIGIKLK
jgi:hypothetical protein